jgi:hypothetical protein
MPTTSLDQPQKEVFTLEDLRKINGFENVSDEEGNHIVETLLCFCGLVYSLYCRENSGNKKTDF